MGAAAAIAHRGLAWLFLTLAFSGWVLMLAGVASLQNSCYGDVDFPQTVEGGAETPVGLVGYLAPVGCRKFFSFVWWIVAFDLFVLILLAVGATTLITTFRGGMIAISAVLLVLIMDTANTFLYFNNMPGDLSSPVPSRARVLVAGAIISSIAYFILIAILGWFNEDSSVTEPYDSEAGGKKKRAGGGGRSGFLGGLFGKGGSKREEEEMGTGQAGSPRIMHVPPPPAHDTSPGRPQMAGSPVGVRRPAATTTTYTTTATATVPVAVAGAAPGSPGGVPLSSSAGGTA